MKFVDQAKIWVRSGKGGDGCLSFRREKYVPRGGPDGGDGGRGGHVILEASSQKDTLFRFHMNQHFRASNGRPGMGKDRTGAGGDDLVIDVPMGTIVFDEETGDQLADLIEPGQTFLAAEGGWGGKGNAAFASSTNRAPRKTTPGGPAVERRLRLELKLLADVGLIGLPNVGKSTLISMLSAARPKIADYPFTTLVPNLGVVGEGEQSFVIADLPGLIEGAADGAGLGRRFLKHAQRCRVLLHILDAGQIRPDEPLADYLTIRRELADYDPDLAAKPEMIAVNKMDLTGADQALAAVAQAFPDRDVRGLSAATGQGVQAVKYDLFQMLGRDPDQE